MNLFAQILQYSISGITSGSIYGVVGLCWAVVYIITKVLNFATGEFVMLGGMLTWGLHAAGLGLFPAMLLAVAGTIVIAVIIERLAIRPVRFPSEMTYMMITIAVASVIRGVVMLAWGTEAKKIEPFFGSGVIQFLGASITPQAIGVLAFLVVVTIGLNWFFQRTLVGKALRASAVNQTGAKLIGIDINKFRLLCFCLAGGLGALTGIVTTPVTFTGYEIGALTGIKGMVVAIVGGWTIRGTVVAALILGLLEGLCAGFVSTGFKDVLALLTIMVFLIARTYGIASKARRT